MGRQKRKKSDIMKMMMKNNEKGDKKWEKHMK